MSSNPQTVHLPSKTAHSSSALTPPPSQSSHSFIAGAESQGQRRSGSSSSQGAGSKPRTTLASARNSQGLRKQHKSQRKPKLGNEDALAESAAMKSTSSRKGQTSITHLMNFSLPPRPSNGQGSNFHGRNGRRNTSWGLGSGHHGLDKARYVHANYRFLVDPRGDYRAQAVDADVHLEWDSIFQILASLQTQCSACPICLSTPVAPRMAKCGHIFCLPCLIRYMHSTDDVKPIPEKRARWKKCPICWDSIYISEVRPVRWFQGQESLPPHEEEDVVLRLLMRQPGSTLALPRDGVDELVSSDDIPWHSAAEVMDHARVMKASEEYLLAQFDGEVEQLQFLEREDELIYGDEPEWTKKAVLAIRESKEKVKGIGNPPTTPNETQEKRTRRPPIEFDVAEADVPEMYMLQHAVRSGKSFDRDLSQPQDRALTPSSSDTPPDGTLQPTLTTSVIPSPQALDRKLSQSSHANARGRMKSSSLSKHQESPYYFYHALLHYYLSPLDIRVLKAAFGDYTSFPATILPRVEHVSTGHIVDDDLRKRAKYLAHLPYGCEVGFLECNWTDVVAPEVLERFKPELERRRRRNKEKEVREEKERVRAEKEEEDKRWAAVRRRRPSISQEVIVEEDFQPLANRARNHLQTLSDSEGISTSPPWSFRKPSHTGSAFASLASPSTSPVPNRTVWGTAAIIPPSPPQPPASGGMQSSEPDGWLQGWENDLLRGETLIAQVEAASLSDEGVKISVQGNSSKKKKGKKITLMSTNARRGA